MKKRIRLYNKQTYSKVNDDNRMLLDDYMAELELQGKSKATCYQYKADIRAFYCWLVKYRHNVNILKVKKRTYRMFFLQLIKNQTSHNRINRLESSLRNLIEFAVNSDDYDINNNPMAHIKGMQKQLVRKIYFLTDKDVTMMINYCLKHQKYQIALFASLAYDSAGRRNELRQVTKEPFIKGKSMSNTVVGKEDKKFKLLIFPRSKRIAKLWLKQRGNDNIKSIWRTKVDGKYKAASYQVMYYWVLYLRKVLQKCRLDHKYIPFNVHTFRHSALQNLADGSHLILREIGKKKMSLNTLRIYAHHSNVSTTQSYLKNNDKEKLENAFDL